MAGKTGVTIVVKSNRLPAISDAIRPAVVEEVRKAAYEIEARSKALALVRTGTMRRSIHTVFEQDGLAAIVGPSVFYAKFVEFLHKPFMRPAAEAVLPRFADAVKRAIAGLR